MRIIIAFLIITANVAYAQDAAPEERIYHMADLTFKPDYVGGFKSIFKFVSENFRSADVEERNGRLTVQFLVEKDGTISNTEVLEHIGPRSKKEILRVFKKLGGKWRPGKYDGEPVRSYYIFRLNFTGH